MTEDVFSLVSGSDMYLCGGTPGCAPGTGSPTPAATPTPTATAPTSTPTPKPTASRKPTATPTATPTPKAPFIGSLPPVILVGSTFNITGADFTAGSVANFFVATSAGPINVGPFAPTATTLPTKLTFSVPATTTLGQGFVSVQVVNTDVKGFPASNPGYALLQGSAVAGFPTIKAINGMGLAATSDNPSFATNNVQTVVGQGAVVKLGGSGFDPANGVTIDLFCACPGGKVGPFFLNPSNAGLSSSLLSFTLPARGAANSPPTGPGSFVISNAGAARNYAKRSNAVSVPIGAQIKVTSIAQSAGTIMVIGAGFSTLTAINFFNQQPGGVINLGGVTPGGAPKIALVFVDENEFKFKVPSGAMPGPSYVQVLNPPFVPFTSSGNDPHGAFTLK